MHFLKKTGADVDEEQLARWAMQWCNKPLLKEEKLIFLSSLLFLKNAYDNEVDTDWEVKWSEFLN